MTASSEALTTKLPELHANSVCSPLDSTAENRSNTFFQEMAPSSSVSQDADTHVNYESSASVLQDNRQESSAFVLQDNRLEAGLLNQVETATEEIQSNSDNSSPSVLESYLNMRALSSPTPWSTPLAPLDQCPQQPYLAAPPSSHPPKHNTKELSDTSLTKVPQPQFKTESARISVSKIEALIAAMKADIPTQSEAGTEEPQLAPARPSSHLVDHAAESSSGLPDAHLASETSLSSTEPLPNAMVSRVEDRNESKTTTKEPLLLEAGVDTAVPSNNGAEQRVI